MIFLISFSFRAFTAIATPVYVFPVPAGPIANIKSLSKIDLWSFFWFVVLANMGLPEMPCKISEGLSPLNFISLTTISFITSGSILL